MSQHKVDAHVVPVGKRHRAAIVVDKEFEVEHAWFTDKQKAEEWAKAKKQELQAALA